MTGHADWAALPSDVFYILLAEHFSFSDFAVLADVCTSWRVFIRQTVFDPTSRLKTLAYGHGDPSKHWAFCQSVECILDQKFARYKIVKYSNKPEPGAKVHQLFTQLCISGPEEDQPYLKRKKTCFLRQIMGEAAAKNCFNTLSNDPLFEPAVEGPVVVKVRYNYSYHDIWEPDWDEPYSSEHEDEDSVGENNVLCDSPECLFRRALKRESKWWRPGHPGNGTPPQPITDVPFNTDDYDFKEFDKPEYTANMTDCQCVNRNSNKDPEREYLTVVFKLHSQTNEEDGSVNTKLVVADLIQALEENMKNIWRWEETMAIPSIHLALNPLGWLDVQLDCKLLASKDDACLYIPGRASGLDFPSPLSSVDDEDAEGEDNPEHDMSSMDEDSEYWSDHAWSSDDDEEMQDSIEETVKLLFGDDAVYNSGAPLGRMEEMDEIFPAVMYDDTYTLSTFWELRSLDPDFHRP